MPYHIVRQEISTLNVDAVIHFTNNLLQVDDSESKAICKATDAAVITPGSQLPAKHIIHIAYPTYADDLNQAAAQLRACYLNGLSLAAENHCLSVALPLFTDCVPGYPDNLILHAATTAISHFLKTYDIDVFLVVPENSALAVEPQVLKAVARYVAKHYNTEILAESTALSWSVRESDSVCASIHYDAAEQFTGLDQLVESLDEPFATMLLHLIDAKGLTDVEVYKRANIDRRLFSKIRSNKGYKPGKRTAVALAIALELSLEETRDLLQRAGYALSPSQKFDVIVEYFIRTGQYDLFTINEMLFHYDQPLLGG
ncbi:MAG: macro domain-containing protein [Limnochordia bacterium]|jgi:hypothetical protein